MSKFRIAIIGCGFISYAHIKGWIGNGCDVVAVCDIDTNRAEQRAKEFNIKKTYSDYKEMLDKEDIDIIDIATPVFTHKELIIACAVKKINILCEKPFVNNLEDGRYLVKLCEKNECKLMICQTYRWHPWYEQIKKELDSGIIGRPYYANIMQRVCFDIPIGKDAKIALLEDQPFYENVEMLMLLEQGCHYIDAFRFFFGEPVAVQAHIDYISPFVKGDDMAVVLIKFKDMVAVLEDLWCTNAQEKTSVTFVQGKKGSINFEGTAGSAPHRTKKTGGLEISLMDGTRYVREMNAEDYYARSFEKLQKHFIDCIIDDKEPTTSGKDNLKTLEIAFKAYEASKKQRTTFLGEV